MRADIRTVTCALLLCTAIAAAPAQGTTREGRLLRAGHLPSTASFSVVVPAGSIRLVGWDRDSIEVRSAVSPQGLYFGLMQDGGKLGVQSDVQGRAERADLLVYFPRHGRVRVQTASADITATDVAGDYVSASGSIRIAGTASSVEADAMSGNLDLDVDAPWVRARTGAGRLVIRGAPQDVDASTVSGTLDIATDAVRRGRFASVTGDIRYSGLPASGGLFEFSNHAGATDFLLPRTASARFDLSSITGVIENGFAETRPVSAEAHSVRLSLGRGDAQITVRTFKGPIRLRPRP